MAKQLANIGEYKEAEIYLKKALKEPSSQGKVLLFIALDMATFAQQNQQPNLRDKYTQIARVKLAELGTPLELAMAYYAIAVIDFNSGKYSSAEQLINLSLRTFEKESDAIGTIAALRLNAQIKLKQYREAAGLSLMEQAISLAEDKSRYADLKISYGILASYFAKQRKFLIAYKYQQKQLDALEKETQFKTDIWLSQLKSGLSREQQIAAPNHSLLIAATADTIIPKSLLPIIKWALLNCDLVLSRMALK